MNEFKRGFGFGLWIGFIMAFVVIILFLHSPAQAQQKQTPAQQLQQAKIHIAKQDIIIADIKLERNNMIVEISRLDGLIQIQRNGILKSEQILQEAINNDKKVDFNALVLAGWSLVLPDSTGEKSKDNPQ